MLVINTKLFSAVTFASVLCVSAWGQATPAADPPAGDKPAAAVTKGPCGETIVEKKVKDRGEYDLYDSILKEQNAQKRLASLNTWKEKYPQTDYQKERLLFYLGTYQQLGKAAEIIETANQILAVDPKDFTAMYWLALMSIPPATGDTSAAILDRGQKAAQGMLANLDETFASCKKPAGTDDAAWSKAKNDMAELAHKTLGWVAMARKDYDAAQKELNQALTMNPNDGFVSYWLGQTLYATKNEQLIPAGLYNYARADVYDGPGAMDAAARKQIDDFLSRAYKGFHGDLTGLPELKAQAKQSAMPPAGFTIRSVTEIAKDKMAKEEEFNKQNPQLALWMGIKDKLAAADGAQYFEKDLKDAGLPKLRGKLVSQSPAVRPKTLVLAMDGDAPQVTLRLSAPLAGKAEPGTMIEFEGVPKEFTASPFMLTIEVEKEKIFGWPAQAAPPARTGAAHSTKKGTRRK